MNTCTVNGLTLHAATDLETWGQLLASLERGDGPARTVVAAVRFAGVDQPTFREPETLALDLHLAAPIDVELYTTGDLVASAKTMAIGALETLAESARQTAEAFRLHNLPSAHRGLADFVSTFQLLTTLTVAVGCADPSCKSSALETTRSDFLERMNTSLGSLIDFDVNEDWISVADVLEYEIADLMPQWAAVIRVAGAVEPHTLPTPWGIPS